MKNITLLLILMFAVVNFAKADETEVLYKKVWTGNKAISWNTSLVPGEQFYTEEKLFTGFTNNHAIKINVATYGEPTYALRYITTDDWIEPNNSEWSVSDGTLSYTPNEVEVEHIKERGLVLSGQNYKVTEIKIDETSVWKGTKFISWNESVPGAQFQTSSVKEDMFENLTYGNTIKVTVSGYGDPQYTFKYRSGDDWIETNIETDDVTVTDGVATISVTDPEIAGVIAARGLVITGQAYFVKAISYGMDVTATTISSTSTDLDWNPGGKNMELSGSNRRDLANAYINDIIRVTYKTAASGEYGLQLKNPDGWGYLEEGVSGTTPTYSASDQTFDYQITKGGILQIVKNNGIILQGLNVTVKGVKLLKPEDRYDVQPVSIGADCIATYSHSEDLDFSGTGVSVWVATGYETGKVTLTKIENGTTWNYQGYILKADAEGTYYPKKSSATWPGTNYLMGNVGENSIPATTIPNAQNAITYYNYIFAKDGDDIGFYKLTASHTLAAHRAYLSVPQDITITSAGARVSMAFDDGELTSIQSVRKQTINDNVYYTLSGQRVAQPTKGLYIVNGKKVVIK